MWRKPFRERWKSNVNTEAHPGSALAALRSLRNKPSGGGGGGCGGGGGGGGDDHGGGGGDDDHGGGGGGGGDPFRGGPGAEENSPPFRGGASSGAGEAEPFRGGPGEDDGEGVSSGEEDAAGGGGEEEPLRVGERGAAGGARHASVESELLDIFARHSVSLSAMEDVTSLLKRCGGYTAQELPTFKSIHLRAVKEVPIVRIDYEWRDDVTGAYTFEEGKDKIPRAVTSDRERSLIFSLSYVSVGEIVKFHKSLNPNHDTSRCSVAADNVPVTRSKPQSFDVLSISFPNCKNTYPVRIFLAEEKIQYDLPRNLQVLLDELEEEQIKLEFVVADLPKKSKLVCLQNCGGYYSCGYCLIKGKHSELSKTVAYPFSHDQPHRTLEDTLTILNDPRFEEWCQRGNHTTEERKGWRGRSPLLRVEGFDIINDVPVDCLHNLHLGVVRRTFHRTFDTGQKIRGMRRQRQKLDQFNRMYPRQPSTGEQTRKPRVFCVFWKGTEYRSLITAHFPFVLSILAEHPDPQKELLRDIWALLGYLSHVLTGDTAKYERAELILPAQDAMHEFGRLYEEYFGWEFCNYNCHLFLHCLEVRQKFGDISRVSAYESEGMYQYLLRSFRAGTQSVSKQGLQNVYLSFQSSHHLCQFQLKFAAKESGKSQNNFVYTNGFNMWKIENVAHEEKMLAAVQVTAQPFLYTTSAGTVIPFGEIGVFEGPLLVTNERKQIAFASVCGKVISNNEYIVCLAERPLTDGN